MGKKSGTSWLTLVKRAFNRKRNEYELEEEEKRREKKRWPFRKPNDDVQQCEAKVATNTSTTKPVIPILAAEQRHAYAVAAATAAAAKAAVATAQAAVEIVRLTRPSGYAREHYAATIIQTAFRGYLARRALRALKGLVKLQALVRGQNVRNQAKLTLKCVQALVRAQDKVRDQRARLSHEGSRKSMFAEANNFWDCTNFQDIKNRKSMSNNVSRTLDDWEDFQSRKDAAMKREKSLAYAFANQIWRSRRNPSVGDEKEIEERTKWLERWMATKQWENGTNYRVSIERRDHIKNVEIDISKPNTQKSQLQNQSHYHKLQRQLSVASPLHRSRQNFSLQQSPAATATPPPCKTKPIQVRSASPRFLKEERSYSAAQTPNLNNATPTTPNYMAATVSAKARARSQSVPRQRPSTPGRERSGLVKKRLSYPAPPEAYSGVANACMSCSCSQNSRSTSFKSVPDAYPGTYSGLEQTSNYSSCLTESYGGEISPCPSGSRFSLNLWE